MGRYWLKIEEAVEGPYESHLLKFVDGFNQETLVCPEESEGEEFWKKADEFPELRKVLGIPEPAAASVESPAEPTVKPLLEESKIEILSTPKEEIAEELEIQPSILEPMPSPETREEVPSLASEPENKPVEEVDTESDILEVMEKIKEERKKQKEEKKEDVPAAAFPQAIKKNEEAVSVHPWKRMKIVASLLALGCVGAAAFFWKEPLGWKPDFLSTHLQKFRTNKESIQTKPVQKILIPEKPPEKKIEKITPMTLEGKTKPKTMAKKIVVAKSTRTAKEEELNQQKYLLPGVPAPQVTQEKKSSTPAEEVKEEKKKKREKQFKDVEWMSKTGW